MATPPIELRGHVVPIVGAALKAHTGYVMASFTCCCRPDNPPQLIRGTDLIVVCFHCRSLYGITKVEFDRAAGQREPLVSVMRVGRASPDELASALAGENGGA